METLKLKNINLKGGYRIELSENNLGQLIGHSMRVLNSGKNKGGFKTIERFRFKNDEHRNQWIQRVMNSYSKMVSRKEEEKKAKIEARKNMKHEFEVGQILYDSWGYEQTNIDFYQIVEVLPKSVKIRKISGERVEGTEGHDCCNVRPLKDSFCGEPELKKITFSIYNNGVHYRIKSRHGAISLYDRGDRGVYSSWGY